MKNIKLDNKLTKDIAKPEFWIGLTTTLVLIGVVGLTGYGQLKNYQESRAEKQKLISPIPVAKDNSEKMAVKPTVAVTPNLSQIKKLADTSGEITVIARENDTFWHISKRVCGDGQYFGTIERLNGYQDTKLQPGDSITVYCY